MSKIFPKIIVLVLWVVFLLIVLKVPYPETITQANLIQLLGFFIPLFIAITFSLNLLIKNILMSASLSLGLVFILIVKSLDTLNMITAVLIISAVTLLLSYFKDNKGKNLTKRGKIPKLTRLQK